MTVPIPEASLVTEKPPVEHEDRARIYRDLWISLAFIAVVAVHYLTLLPVGNIQHGDEYLTLDRSHSFTIRDDYLAVYTNNVPDFRKPPLQYWMTGALLSAGVDLEVALRFPSYLFSILTLGITGLLAFLCNPQRPFVAPAAIAVLAGSATFWGSAVSGLLDAGAMFFSTLAVTSCLLAFRNPGWWYLTAAAVGVGALQKAPVPLALVALTIIFAVASARWSGLDVKRSLGNRHFVIAMVLMLAAVLLWPVLQFIKFGSQSVQQAYVDQMVHRFSPFGGEEQQGRRSWSTIMLGGEPVLRVPAIAALFWLPWGMRRLELGALPLLLLAFAVMAAFASGYVSPRYSLIFLPMMVSALAVVTLELFEDRPAIGYGIILVLALSSLGPIKSATALGISDEDKTGNVKILREVASALRSDETLVTCRGARNGKRLYAGAVSYYASNGRPFVQVRDIAEIARMQQKGFITPPYRGVCNAGQGDAITAAFGENAIVGEANGFVHWQSGRR